MEFPSLAINAEKLREELNAPDRCQHQNSELRKKPDKNGNPRLHTQCLECGSSVGPRISIKKFTKTEIEGLPLFDETIQKQRWADFQARFSMVEAQRKQELKERWRECYELYLQTPEWKHRRSLVLKRAAGWCEGCMKEPSTEVHHTTYDNVGEEFLFQLVALCRVCHERLHTNTLPALLERFWSWEAQRQFYVNRWADTDEPF